MRKFVPKIKNLETVKIPNDFLKFIKEVQTAIESNAEEALIECDDCLQSDTAYGGLLEEGGKEYGFTYFPNHASRGVRDKWEIILSRDQIADIAAERSTTLQLWSCASPDCESKFPEESESCFDCDWEDDNTQPQN